MFRLELREEGMELVGAFVNGLKVVLKFGFGHWWTGGEGFVLMGNIFISNLIMHVYIN